MSLEAEARQEFARILTKVTHIMNGVLDGRPWGKVGQDDITTEYSADRVVCLDAFVQGYRMTMHAAYEPDAIEHFYRAREQMGYKLVTLNTPKDGIPGYVIVAEPHQETISA